MSSSTVWTSVFSSFRRDFSFSARRPARISFDPRAAKRRAKALPKPQWLQ